MKKIVRNGGVEIATETFGKEGSPAVLLVMGAMASMLWWPDLFCAELADRGHFVIRYDNRDTGSSTRYAPGNPPYSMEDMAGDAMAVLDAYGLASAHFVGMSLGGKIAQIAAFSEPDRIDRLTLISTTPVGVDTSDLPQMAEAYLEHGADGENVDWNDNGEVIEYLVKDMSMIASTRHPHDAPAARDFIERDVARSGSFASATNHFLVEPANDWAGALARLRKPLTVVHGTTDPLFPIGNGRRIADTVPDAQLVEIDGGGHELHPNDWPEILKAISGRSAVA